MKNAKAIRRAVYRTPLPGRTLTLLGALLMLAWSVWECAVRLDAMDGVTKAYFRLAREQGTPLGEALRVLWDTEEARKDLLNPAILGCVALFSLFALVLHRRWKPGFLCVPVCVAILFFHTSDIRIVRALNLFETMKLASCAAVAAGSGCKIVCALNRRRREHKRISEPERKNARLSHGNASTLIPERVVPRRPR